MIRTLVATGPDGTEVRATDQGAGPTVLVVHGGLDSPSSWQRVARQLAGRYRLLALDRRQYRADLAGTRWTIADEAADVIALATTVGEPVLVVGHSSGGVVALEALVAAPALFAGAVLYEPPVHLRPGEWDEPIAQARSTRSVARSMAIFLRAIVGLPAWQAWPAGAAIAAVPRVRRLAPRQIDDADAINQLGVRLDAYAGIQQPVTLLGGTTSPRHLRARLAALSEALPDSTTVLLDGQGHGAHVRAPQRVAEVIATRAGAVQ
jgi:pimeloyl-ACP methyl ester carboxylesterase